jgi:surface polysaccharide O-acyltransferase-like enzyme
LVILGYEREPFFAYIPKLLVYLVAGYLIYRDQPRPPLARLLLLGVACVGGEMLVMRLLQPSALTLAAQAFTQTVLALCALGWVVTVFLLVMRLSMGQRLNRLAGGLAPFMLGIYVQHPFWMDVLDRTILPFKQGQAAWPLAAVAAYALSAASSWLIARVTPLRRLVC